MPRRYKPIIDCYCRGEKYRLHQMLSLCSNLHDFVFGIEISQNGKRKYNCCLPACHKDCFAISRLLNWHQQRIPKSVLYSFLSKVSILHYQSRFICFDDFFEYIAKNCGLKNGHCLLVYDFCLRQGQHLTPKLEPDKYVYLFRGAREGAEHVLGKLQSSVYKLPTKVFHLALKTKMSSMEIEHFLCVCKEHIGCIGTIGRPAIITIFAKIIAPAIRKDFGFPLKRSELVAQAVLEQFLAKHHLCSDEDIYQRIIKHIESNQ